VGMKTISSQRLVDPDIVFEKQKAEDYVVMVATLDLLGKRYRVVIDGHHSLAAAELDGVKPEFVETTYNYQSEVDTIGAEQWLMQHWNDSEWYDVKTGLPVRW